MIGLAIKKAREEKGLFQSELATACKISTSLVSQIESGKIKNPGWSTMCKIAKELDLDMYELML